MLGLHIKCAISSILYVLDLQYSLVSVTSLSENGTKASFISTWVSLTKDRKSCASGNLSGGRMYLAHTFLTEMLLLVLLI